MIVLGLILIVVGWLIGLGVLVTIGLVLLVLGIIFELLGGIGHPVLGRRHYY